MDIHKDGKIRNTHFDCEINQDEMQKYNEKISAIKKYIPFLEKLIGKLENHSHKVNPNHVLSVKNLHSMVVNPKSRIKWETLVKVEMFLKKLYDRRHHQSENSTCNDINNFMDTIRRSTSPDRFHSPSRPRTHEHHGMSNNPDTSPHSWNSSIRERTSISPRAKTTYLGDSHEPTTSYTNQRVFGSNYSRSSRPHSTSTNSEFWRDRYQWEQQRNSQNERYSWNESNSSSPPKSWDGSPRQRFRQENYHQWDGNSNNPNEQNCRLQGRDFESYKMPSSPYSTSAMRHQTVSQLMRPPESTKEQMRTRDPRLLYGRVNPASMNIRSACPPSVYVPSSRRLSDEVETPRSPSPEPDVPVIPPIVVVDSSLESSSTSATGEVCGGSTVKEVESSKLDEDGGGIEEEKQVYSCEYCSYIGKKIISHHVNRHGDKEVPVTLSKKMLDEVMREEEEEEEEDEEEKSGKKGETVPEVGKSVEMTSVVEDLSWIPERSIFRRPIDCKICGYTTVVKTNLIQHLISHRNPDKSTSLSPMTSLQFNCRFCDSSTTNCQEFRDHVSTHTGEFQYMCGYCPFRGFSSKSVRTHINCEHVGKPAFVKRERDSCRVSMENKVFGYVCSFCRFVQLSEENVDAHIRRHTSKDRAKVLRINMSKSSKVKSSTKKVKGDKNDGEEKKDGDEEEEERKDEVDPSPQVSTLSEMEIATQVYKDDDDDDDDDEGELKIEMNEMSKSEDEMCATQVYIDSENEDESVMATQKYVDSEEDGECDGNKDENEIATQKYVDSEEEEEVSKKIEIDSDVEENNEGSENQGEISTQVCKETESENENENESEVECERTSTSQSEIATQVYVDEDESEDEEENAEDDDEDEEEEEDDDDEDEEEEEEQESDNSSYEGSKSPPHLEPEQSTIEPEEDDEDDEEVLSLNCDADGQLPPSIAETISRLQATLKKGVKRSSLPPPVLEPMDGKTARTREEPPTSSPVILPEVPTAGSGVFKCGAKSCGFFSSDENVFVQHLEASHSPREAPCTECGGCFAQWKLLLAHLRSECEASDKMAQFTCGFSSCDFATNNEVLFFSHTRRTHKKEMQLPCGFCQKSFTLVTSLVRHLKECRAKKSSRSKVVVKETVEKKVKDDEVVKKEDKKDEVGEVKGEDGDLALKVVYRCPVSTCDHKSLERDVFRCHVLNFHSDDQMRCKVCLKKLDDVKVAIEHMESDHKDEETVRTGKRSIGDGEEVPRKRVFLDEEKEKEEEEEEKATPILRAVEEELLETRSDVEPEVSSPLPLESFRQRDPSVESLTLKSPEALSVMLEEDELRNLFKCMEWTCSFSTSSKEEFVLHLSEVRCSSRYLCAYCTVELAGVGDLVDHIVNTHGHCTFQCKYCFYRAITEEYVIRHQQKRHFDLERASLVCERDPEAVDLVNEPVSSEFVIPYRCAIDGCNCEVADPEEFRQHNLKEHSSTSLFPCHLCGVTCLSPDRLLVHYKVHGCNNYQCGFCLHGCESDEEILFHLCCIHPNRRGRLIVRSVSNNKLLEGTNYQLKRDGVKPILDLGSLKMEVTRSTIKPPTTQPTPDKKDTPSSKEGERKVGHELFQCGYPPCVFSSTTVESLREHMVTCTSSCLVSSAKCPHCCRQWRTIGVFLEHLVSDHGGRRFLCGKCKFTDVSLENVQEHMKCQHGLLVEQTKCELRDQESDPEVGEYVVQEVVTNTPTKTSKLEGKSERRMMVTRKGTTFGVSDMDRLPIQCIFSREISCAVCGYATKVRSNLLRHLVMHQRQHGDKTNVECKGKEDKSKHSKTSSPHKGKENNANVDKVDKVDEVGEDHSTTGVAGILCPQFVPDTSLYRCAVEGCDYLALDTTMYKCHVTTLHPDVGAFPCPHCGERTTSLDKLLIHFRLHGPRLYKCNECNYSSYRHHQIETHHNTAHGNRFLPVVTIREKINQEEKSVQVKTSSGGKKEGKFLTPTFMESPSRVSSTNALKGDTDSRHVWCCAICTHPGPTKSIIKNHLQTCHGVRSEFKCGVCSCVSNAFESVRLHFVSRHPNTEVKIMPLIVKVKDYDPNNLYVTAPKESSSVVSSGSGRTTTSGTVGLPPASMPVTRRASLTAAAAAIKVDDVVEMATKSDGGSSKESTPTTDAQDRKSNKSKVKEEVEGGGKGKEGHADGSGNAKVMFVCPVCHEYRTKFRGDMRIHIYRELHYRRVQCLRCNALFVSEKEAKHHSFKTHSGLTLSLQKNEIPERENWVKEQLDGQVLAWGSVPRSTPKQPKMAAEVGPKVSLIQDVHQNVEQNVEMAKMKEDEVKDEVKEEKKDENVDGQGGEGSEVTSVEEGEGKMAESTSRQFRYYCTQCSYQCEGTTDLRKHIFRHLKFKPFQCPRCLTRFSEKQQIRNHHNLFHPDDEFVCERQPNSEPERYVDELLHQQRMEWKDKKKSGSPVIKMTKTAAQITVAKMAAESVTTMTTEGGSVQNVYACRHDGCNFTCDQLKGLKVHLMAHLRQARFHCGYCSVTGSSQYQVRRHCLSIHAGKKVLVLAIKPENAPVTSSTPEVGGGPSTEASTVVTTTTQRGSASRGLRLHRCPYCPYSHTLPKMISRHLMRHYVEKPFQCGHCKRTGIEKFDILYHCKKVHPDLEPKVIATPLPTNPEIRPILRRGHGHSSVGGEEVGEEWGGHEESTATSTAVEGEEQMESLPLEVQVTELSVDQDAASPTSMPVVTTRRVFECVTCMARFNSKEEVRGHLDGAHQDSGNSYRVIVTALKKSTIFVEEAEAGRKLTPTSLLEPSTTTGSATNTTNVPPIQEIPRTSLLKCIYCDLASDSLKLLRKHCHESHTGSEVRLRKMAVDWEATGETMLRCGYCPFAVSQMAMLWDHHRQEHVDKAVKFRIAARKGVSGLPASCGARKGKSGMVASHVLWCAYCNDPCESIEQMVRHWKMFHGHLELKYKTQTGEEGIISKELTDGALQGEENSSMVRTGKASSTSTTSSGVVGESGSGASATATVTIYGCAQCKYESDKYDMVRQHLFRHLHRFSCPACRKLYPFEYELKKHFEIHHQGLVLDSVKNPDYDDQEKEELIRNIRVRHVEKNVDGKVQSEKTVEEKVGKSRQIARKSLRGMSVVPPMSRMRLSAKKSTSSKLKASNLMLKSTLEENLPLVQLRQQQIISQLTNVDGQEVSESFSSTPPAKRIRLEESRVSLSYRDLFSLVNLQPSVVIDKYNDQFYFD